MNNRRRVNFRSGNKGPVVPIEDAISLMSFRKLNPAYSGPCVQIRRASDNADLDVGFVSDYVDQSAISAFCAGTTGHVKRWYDQSGNGNTFNNDTFSGVTSMGKIYQSGAFFINGGKIGINFTASERLEAYTSAAAIYRSAFAVVKMNSLATINYLLYRSSPQDGLILGGNLGGVTGFGVLSGGLIRNMNTVENLNRNLQTYIGTSLKKVYTNGANLATEASATAELSIGAISRPGFSINGNIQEMLIYSTAKDSERVSIENSINAYYSIY